MKNKNYGMKVNIKLNERLDFKNHNLTYRNVTEIHFCYPSLTGKEKKIAFESDIHGTGSTWHLADIDEFETSLETKKEKSF